MSNVNSFSFFILRHLLQQSLILALDYLKLSLGLALLFHGIDDVLLQVLYNRLRLLLVFCDDIFERSALDQELILYHLLCAQLS